MKLPWMKFYPADWNGDMRRHPLEIRGAWLGIVCAIWSSGSNGTLSLTREQWASELGVTMDVVDRVVDYCGQYGVANVSTRGQVVDITCRRLQTAQNRTEYKRLWQQRKRVSTACGQNEDTPEDSLGTDRSQKSDVRSQKKDKPPSHSPFVQDAGRKSPGPAPASGEQIELDRKTGKWTGISADKLAYWTDTYGAVNVADELRKAAAWVVADWARRRKVKWERFIVGWLGRCQDRGGNGKPIPAAKPIAQPRPTINEDTEFLCRDCQKVKPKALREYDGDSMVCRDCMIEDVRQKKYLELAGTLGTVEAGKQAAEHARAVRERLESAAQRSGAPAEVKN